VRLDQASAAHAIERIIGASGGKPTHGSDPIALMKASRIRPRSRGARGACARRGGGDAFLAWLDREAPKANSPKSTRSRPLRASGAIPGAQGHLVSDDLRRRTNGAIVHYRVTRKSNRRIGSDELFLVDSGAQYEDGTTDITRTVAIGAPRATCLTASRASCRTHRDRTRRLSRWHSGAQLDPLARYIFGARASTSITAPVTASQLPLCARGSGTHRQARGAALKRGMILSNEPGYYKTGAYGIRIENLVLVTEAEPVPDAERPLNTSRPDARADRSAPGVSNDADGAENAWLNAYHTRVRETLSPLVDAETRAWLEQVTCPIGKA